MSKLPLQVCESASPVAGGYLTNLVESMIPVCSRPNLLIMIVLKHLVHFECSGYILSYDWQHLILLDGV